MDRGAKSSPLLFMCWRALSRLSRLSRPSRSFGALRQA